MTTQLVDIEGLINEAHDLEPLPQSAVRMAGVLSSDDWNIDAVQEIVRLDQALTGKLIGAANSVRSGARIETTSVDQAIVRLGGATVLSLAVGAAVRAPLQRSLPILGIGEGELWRHSVASALATELARKHIERTVPPQAFATALLHDVGKLILERHLDENTAIYLQRSRAEGQLMEDESEQEVLQVSHAEVGGLITRAWGLPKCIAEGIQYHHQPLDAPDEEGRLLAYLIGLSDAVSTHIGEGCGEIMPASGLSPDIAGALGLPRAAFETLCEETSAGLELILEQYS